MGNTFRYIGPRGCGRTTAIAEACRKIGASMVCANHQHAKQVEHDHGIKAVSLGVNVVGTQGPYLFDHFTVDTLSTEYEQEIDRLRTALEQAEVELDDMKVCEACERTVGDEVPETMICVRCYNSLGERMQKAERQRDEARGCCGKSTATSGLTRM